MKKILVANWKMNLTLAESIALGQAIKDGVESLGHSEVVLAPSLPWLAPLQEALHLRPAHVSLASQVVSQWPEGAYTGDVSAKQLKGLVTYCLVGHSERRQYHKESGSAIAAQIQQLLAQPITPIVCFGELHQSKQHGISPQITADLKQDLEGLSGKEIGQCLFAYEPVWAIGTGLAATPEYAQRVVTHVKEWINEQFGVKVPILYGGSVSEDNAADFAKEGSIDGLLVGGASLNAARFTRVCERFLSHV